MTIRGSPTRLYHRSDVTLIVFFSSRQRDIPGAYSTITNQIWMMFVVVAQSSVVTSTMIIYFFQRPSVVVLYYDAFRRYAFFWASSLSVGVYFHDCHKTCFAFKYDVYRTHQSGSNSARHSQRYLTHSLHSPCVVHCVN
jgi:hypothetical protein